MVATEIETRFPTPDGADWPEGKPWPVSTLEETAELVRYIYELERYAKWIERRPGHRKGLRTPWS